MPDEILQNPQFEPAAQPAERKKISIIVITVLTLLILVLMGGIGALFFFESKNNNSGLSEINNEISQQDSGIANIENIEAYNSSSAEFRQSLENLSLTEDFITIIKEDPSYLQDDIAIANLPDYRNLTNEEVAPVFKKGIMGDFENIDNEVRRFIVNPWDFSEELGNFLGFLSYVARISKSPYLDDETRAGWLDAVSKGRVVVSDILVLMGDDYRVTAELWIEENVYSREEFQQ